MALSAQEGTFMSPVAAAGIKLMGEVLAYQNTLRDTEAKVAQSQITVGSEVACDAAYQTKQSGLEQANSYYMTAGQSFGSAVCDGANAGINRFLNVDKENTDQIKTFGDKAAEQDKLLEQAKRIKPGAGNAQTSVGQGAGAGLPAADPVLEGHVRKLSNEFESTGDENTNRAAFEKMAAVPTKKADGSASTQLDDFISAIQEKIETNRKIVAGKETAIQNDRQQRTLAANFIKELQTGLFNIGQGSASTQKAEHDASVKQYEFATTTSGATTQAAVTYMNSCTDTQGKTISELTNALKQAMGG